MALNLADGQLAAASATLLGTSTAERTVGVTLFNTGVLEQTVILSLTRSGSSARTKVRAKLKQYQTLHVRGLGLDPSDVLAGYADSATTVDYVISAMERAEPFSVLILDADGTRKQSADVTLTTTEREGLTMGEVVIAGLLEEVRDVLRQIA